MPTSPPIIAIVGANFAGLSLALRLPDCYRVLVIDPSSHFEWKPGIHELLSGCKTRQQLELSRQQVLSRKGHTLIIDRVRDIDSARQVLVTERSGSIPYDICVLASGMSSSRPSIPGVVQHGFCFQSIEQAALVSHRVQGILARNGKTSMAIIGGGLTGVEVLGELLRIKHRFPRLETTLIEGRDRLLADLPAALHNDLQSHCERNDATVLTGDRVASVDSGSVILQTGKTIPADLCIWAGGGQPADYLSENTSLSVSTSGLKVDRYLRCTGSDSLFAIGDVADLAEPVAKQASHALAMAQACAGNIEKSLKGQRLKPFKAMPVPMLISFGDVDSYLASGKIVLASKWFGLAKEGVFQLNMARLAAHQGILPLTLQTARRLMTSLDRFVLPDYASLAGVAALGQARVINHPFS